MPKDDSAAPQKDEFAEAAARPQASLVGEFLHDVRTYKRWSIVPILLALALLGVFVSLATTGGAPFIYALF